MRRSGVVSRCDAPRASLGGLGSAELVKHADARKVAADNRAIARAGGDPRRLRVPTFEKAEAACFAEKREGWRSDCPANGRRSAMDSDVLGKLGTTPVGKAGRSAAVYEVLRPVALRACRLLNQVGGPKHHLTLHFPEVADALARIDATNCAPSTKRTLRFRFTALTAVRQVEVPRATWEQFDLEGAAWIKHAHATKTVKSHRVPLSRQALAVLAEARKGARGALPIQGTRPGAMMGGVLMTQALRNADVAASGHGCRASFNGWAR